MKTNSGFFGAELAYNFLKGNITDKHHLKSETPHKNNCWRGVNNKIHFVHQGCMLRTHTKTVLSDSLAKVLDFPLE